MKSMNLQDEERLQYYLQFIYQIAASITQSNMLFDDLCQEGYLALLQAQQQYESDFTISFIDFASSMIESRMLEFVQKEKEYIEIKENQKEDYIDKKNNSEDFENIHLHFDLFRSLSYAHLSSNGMKMLLMSYGFVGTYTLLDKAEELHIQVESVPAVERRAMEKIRLRSAKMLLEYADSMSIAQEQLEKARQNKIKVMFRGKL